MSILLANNNTTTWEKLLPPRGKDIYHSGLQDKDKGQFLYGGPSITNPILTIVDPISDDDGNEILSGYYELRLSYDRKTITLVQSGKDIAVIPVFKVEEDKSQVEQLPRTDKEQRALDRKKKKEAKKHKKMVSDGKITDEPIIYNEATIEYDIVHDYYVIKYECGRITAWGYLKI